jgi:hypothetical protein
MDKDTLQAIEIINEILGFIANTSASVGLKYSINTKLDELDKIITNNKEE